LVLDAVDRVTKQDKRIGGDIDQARCGCVIVVNKWDLVNQGEVDRRSSKPGKKRSRNLKQQYHEGLCRELFFLDWAAVLFASAKTGAGLGELFRAIGRVQSEMDRRVETPRLNRLLADCLQSHPPPLVRGRRFKVYYAFQKSSRPPTFTLFVNDGRLLDPRYRRFLIDQIRRDCGFEGCPLLLETRARGRGKPGQK
jgi:GTP-binding protein